MVCAATLGALTREGHAQATISDPNDLTSVTLAVPADLPGEEMTIAETSHAHG